jgi:hypothetical protein
VVVTATVEAFLTFRVKELLTEIVARDLTAVSCTFSVTHESKGFQKLTATDYTDKHEVSVRPW